MPSWLSGCDRKGAATTAACQAEHGKQTLPFCACRLLAKAEALCHILLWSVSKKRSLGINLQGQQGFLGSTAALQAPANRCQSSRSKQAARAGKDITVEVDKPTGLKFKELKGGQGLLVTVRLTSRFWQFCRHAQQRLLGIGCGGVPITLHVPGVVH